jgi:TolB-like protein
MELGGRLAVAGAFILAGFVVGSALYEPAAEVAAPVERRAPAPVAEPPQRSLWVLAIGVSRYAAPDLNLNYADVDARDFAAALAQHKHSALYDNVRTLVLANEEATRETILQSMNDFLARAGPDDVVALFIAGHGVQDQRTGSYYFLPHPADATNFITAGLRMTDIDEMIRVLRREVRAVVVILDTCHAGALHLSDKQLKVMDEPTAALSIGEGLFLLAATKPGELASETAALGHGALTYALLDAIAGRADANADGEVSIAEAFSYAAGEVPRLTAGSQHPYYKFEGIDLPFVVAGGAAAEPGGARAPAPRPLPPKANNHIGVGEFQNVRGDRRHEWVGGALRSAFNTELSKVRALHVYAPDLIDDALRKARSDRLRAARQIGIDRWIIGSYSVVGENIRIDARIVDAQSGLHEGSDSVEGKIGDFFELQKELVLRLLRRLRVRLSPSEDASIQDPSNTDIDAYRLLLDSEDLIESEEPRTPQPSPPLSWLLGVGEALAEERRTETVADEIGQVLEEYRSALQAKDVDRLARLYVRFPQRRREAQQEYFDNVDSLEIEIADVTIAPHPAGRVVEYTRRDRFVDRRSNQPVRLEVRLTRVFIRVGDTWRIGGKP